MKQFAVTVVVTQGNRKIRCETYLVECQRQGDAEAQARAEAQRHTYASVTVRCTREATSPNSFPILVASWIES